MAEETEPVENGAQKPDGQVQEQGRQQDGAQGAPDGGKEKAPWERTGEPFDPEKAWHLIENLRKEKEDLSQKNRAYEDEKLTAKEKADRDLKEAQDKLAQVQTKAAWAEAMAKHPCLSEKDFDLIGAGTPEQVADKAAKLAARIEAQAASDAGRKPTNPVLRANPTGGTDPTAPKSKDWVREALNKD